MECSFYYLKHTTPQIINLDYKIRLETPNVEDVAAPGALLLRTFGEECRDTGVGGAFDCPDDFAGRAGLALGIRRTNTLFGVVGATWTFLAFAFVPARLTALLDAGSASTGAFP